jgi:Putative restriction endonuclease
MNAETTKVLAAPVETRLAKPTGANGVAVYGTDVDPGDEYGPLPADLLWPNVDHLITEDDTPVDNFYSEKQGKLSTHTLYAASHPFGKGRSFIAVADVGLYNSPDSKPLAPDVMISLDVTLPENIWEKRKRSYLIWEFGKTPEVVMEIVSNKIGGEDGEKLTRYSQMRIPYYVIYDPEKQLSDQVLRIYELQATAYVLRTDHWLPSIGLGLVFWHGRFEDRVDTWLRWCDRDGNLLLTGDERAAQERQRAEQEQERAEQERQRAEQEQERAEQERQRAEQAEEKIARLLAQLRALGLDPE